MTYRIGTRLARVEKQGDDWDAIRVSGVYDTGETGVELTVTPADTFGPVASVQADGLGDYRPESAEVGAMGALLDRLDKWQTLIEELAS